MKEHQSLTPGAPDQEKTASKSPKFRGHRKRVDELTELGIETPFKKSDRRERRLFTEEEDHEILRAHSIFGTQWARIIRDSQFAFQDRKSSDLRDRYRTILRGREKAPPPRQSSSKTLEKPRSNEALSGEHPSSSVIIPAQEPLALQSSTLNSGEPRTAEALSRHPSSSDLQSPGTLKFTELSTKETNLEFRSSQNILNGILSSTDLSLQAQTSNKSSEPWMKESNHSMNNRTKYDQSNSYQQPSDLDLRAMTLNKSDDSWPKDQQGSSNTHQPSGISIQEIISTEQEDSRSTLFTFPDNTLPYPEPHPYAHLDWNSNMSIPTLINDVDPSRLTNSMPSGGYGEMDVQRILQNGWEGDMADSSVQGLNGKGKQSFTDINSILSTNDEPTMGSQQPSFFTNMLNADGPLALDDQPAWS